MGWLSYKLLPKYATFREILRFKDKVHLSLFAMSYLLRKILLLFVVAISALTLNSQTPYSRLELKADRFFEQKEWSQAAATYYQMLEVRPDVAATYGKAIVANAVKGDTIAEMDLMVRALNSKIPFDSVLSRVRMTSFQLGKSNLYGDFLLRVKDAYPWMRRPVDNYLLRYYIYRQDGAKMMEYSQMMLQGDPTNTQFLTSLAQGAMLCGNFEEGISAYETILSVSPDDYDSLLALGNYYYIENRTAVEASAKDEKQLVKALPNGPYAEKALRYLSRANALRPTPYVASQISSLTPHIRH